MNDGEKQDEKMAAEVEAADQGGPEAAQAAEDQAVAVRDAATRDVTVPADMLSDALVQLKKLATLRQQEAERQQLAMVRMEKQMKRHTRVNRLVMFSSVAMLLALVISATVMWDMISGNEDIHAGLKVVEDGLGDAARVVRETSAVQGQQIDAVNQTLEAARAEQVKVASRIDTSMEALRVERDAVTAEVREVLEEKTGELTRKEIDLHDRAEQIRQEAVKARAARREIIGDAIQKLVALESAAAAVEPIAADLPTTSGIGIGAYTLKAGPTTIVGATDNASGVTFNPDTKSLFVVLNKPTHVYEVGLDGKTKRIIDLEGFEDTEGIAYVGDNQFAVVEERRRMLCLFEIAPDTVSVNYADAVRITIDPTPAENMGLEGVAFDAVNGRFFIVKEKGPRKIYCLPLLVEGDAAPSPTAPWDIEKQGFALSDLSDIYADPQTGHLLILSHESKCLVECTTDGKEIARLPLQGGSAGLAEDIGQPEGVTMDADGNLYVIAEPNQFYVFSKE